MAQNEQELDNGTGNKTPGKKRISIFTALIIALLLLIGAGYIGYTYVLPLYRDNITQGVLINGIDVSGMTRDDALSRISSYTSEKTKKISVAIRYGDRVWKYGAEELNANADIGQAVDAAMAVARTGNLLQRYNEARDAEAGRYQFSAEPVINVDNLLPYLQDIKAQVDISPVEPTMQFKSEGVKYSIEGYNQWKEGVDYSPLFITTPGENGKETDIDATMDLLRTAIGNNGLTADVGLVTRDVAPQNTEQSLRDSAVILFHSQSKLRSSSSDRTWNIQKALSNFDGMVIAPGQQISYNDIVGQRTIASGYRQAHTIASSGALINDVGGGICQASTTLFNAAIRAGCEVVERNPHSWPLYYQDYGYGLDAMVNWGSSDMKFTNTTGGNLYVDFYFVYSGGNPAYVTIDIYGIPLADGMTIKMESKKISETAPPQPRYEFKTPEQLAGLTFENEWTYDPQSNLMVYEWVTPRTGYVFDVYRLWLKDGEETKREKLYTSNYRTIQGVYYTKEAVWDPFVKY